VFFLFSHADAVVPWTLLINTNHVRNITNYGAVGDGITTNTTAIQNAINPIPIAEICYEKNHFAFLAGDLIPPLMGKASGSTEMRDRELLTTDPDRRKALWPRIGRPGALLVDGEIRGTWRRAKHTVRVDAWARLSRRVRQAVEAEASTLPLPGMERTTEVVWDA
jgi:hypothetical protein